MNQTTMGKRIKYHRSRLGLTQEQLAEKLNVTPQAVSKWEREQSCPDLALLPQLADIFGITVDELLGRQPSAQEETPAQESPVPEQPEGKDRGRHIGFTGSIFLRGLTFALAVVIYGALLLVNQLCDTDVSAWTLLWTLFLCYIGVECLQSGSFLFGAALLLSGAMFLLRAYGVLKVNLDWGIFFALMILLWGVFLVLEILFGKRRWKQKIKSCIHGFSAEVCDEAERTKQPRFQYDCTDGLLRCGMAFSDRRLLVTTPRLEGGFIDCCFGNYTIDFSGVDQLAPDCTVKLDCSFGSVTLLVPERFRANLRNLDKSFAALNVRGEPADLTDGQLTLVIDTNFCSVTLQYV